jgi:hypothetical protein
MSRETLGAYLNDHLGGSVGAIEMMERVSKEQQGTPLGGLLGALATEIRGEQDILRGLLKRLDVRENTVKQAGAWLAEKAGRLKLSDTREGALGRLEVLETLSLGIQGKTKLWLALEAVAHRHPELAGTDFDALRARAREQHDKVEAQRMEAALEAL